MRHKRVGTVLAVVLAATLVEDMRGARAEIAGAGKSAPSVVSSTEFDPSCVRSPQGSPERRVLEMLQAGQRDDALQIAEEALQEAAETSAGRLHWLAYKASRDTEGAIVHLKALARSSHPLSLWARLRLAELLRKSDPSAAADEAEPLITAWTGRYKARSIYALALLDAKQLERAEPLLRKLIDAAPNTYAAAAEAMPLAARLASNPRIEARKEALALYRRVASRAPATEVGKRAKRKADEVLASLPARSRAPVAQVPVDELFVQGQALINAHRYADAETLYGQLADRLRDQPKERCNALLKKARTQELQRKREEASTLFTAVVKTCSESETRVRARFYAGQTLLRLGKPQAAIAQFEALAAEAPRHRLADDALYKAAVAAEDASGPAAKVSRLSALVERFPDGDMRPAARFDLAQIALSSGDLPAALRQLDSLIEEGPGEVYEGMRGRAQYWRARLMQQLGLLEDAKLGYETLAENYPLSYYAQQAIARLNELDAKRVAPLLSALQDRTPEKKTTFPYRTEMQNPAFTRALELMRVGEVALAKEELSAVGAIGESADKTWLWLSAAMLYHAGDYTAAIGLARRRLGSFSTTAPTGKARFLWRIAFPRAYAPLIEKTASEAALSAALIRAIAREESTFDPQSVSSANAYGLIQLIVPTARQNARALGLPSDPESLKRPEINLRIGAEFLRFLYGRYANNPAVVPAAYNAGYVATDRWLQRQPACDLDTWIERIPYAETRNYTRRVLQSYGIYSWLDAGVLPPLPRVLPAVKAQNGAGNGGK